MVGRPDGRLVTLTGPGGVGKTRLAMAVGERLRDRFDAGTVFVPWRRSASPSRSWPAIGRAVGADLVGTDSALQALIERLGDDRWLLILDNLEQVLDVAPDLDELLARCPGVAILATSLTVLRLRAEREYPVPPLPLPPDPARCAVDELAASPAVALFVDRARAVRHDFALTRGQRRGGGGDLPAPGGRAAGDRAGGRPQPAAGPERAADPAGGLARRSGDGHRRHARAPADAAGDRRMERGPARRRRAVAARDRGGVRRRLDARSRRGSRRPR